MSTTVTTPNFWTTNLLINQDAPAENLEKYLTKTADEAGSD
jgi:hypothetical protein